MSARKSFQLASKNREADKHKIVELEFQDPDDPEGEPLVMKAHYPGDGLIMVAIADATSEDSDGGSMNAIMSILKGALSIEDYRTIRGWIKAGDLPADAVGDIFEDLMEEWTTFPTKPSSGSSRSRNTSGTRSTGRARSKELIPATSNPDDSSD